MANGNAEKMANSYTFNKNSETNETNKSQGEYFTKKTKSIHSSRKHKLQIIIKN